MKVGFIGLGRMGGAMSRRLLDGGYEVAVYNRTADKMKSLLDLGAKPAASIGEVRATAIKDWNVQRVGFLGTGLLSAERSSRCSQTTRRCWRL
jgi:6-phosphogluconate dehydrogenase (decarboxylating)